MWKQLQGGKKIVFVDQMFVFSSNSELLGAFYNTAVVC